MKWELSNRNTYEARFVPFYCTAFDIVLNSKVNSGREIYFLFILRVVKSYNVKKYSPFGRLYVTVVFSAGKRHLGRGKHRRLERGWHKR